MGYQRLHSESFGTHGGELTGMEPEVRQALENVGVSLDAKLALAASNRAINKAEEEMQKNETQ